MKKLTQEAFERARRFIAAEGRELELRLFEWHFEAGDAAPVMDALAGFQNEDGGFGRALEGDLRADVSSVLATTVGFQAFREVKAGGDHPMVRRAMEYLLSAYDVDRGVWPIIPKEANNAPHASWWTYEKTSEIFNNFLANPRAEVVGYLYDYSDLVPGELTEQLTEAVVDHLEGLPDEVDMFDMLCYLRLGETESLPEAEKNLILEKLKLAAPHTVTLDEEAWAGGFSVKPLVLAPSPGSPLVGVLAEGIKRNLDFEIEHQNLDGSWSPYWNWSDRYPEAWPQAERDWKGRITLEVLMALRAFGRIEGM